MLRAILLATVLLLFGGSAMAYSDLKNLGMGPPDLKPEEALREALWAGIMRATPPTDWQRREADPVLSKARADGLARDRGDPDAPPARPRSGLEITRELVDIIRQYREQLPLRPPIDNLRGWKGQ
jgi:hypothetical protein